MRSFGSDNSAGALPEVLAALTSANEGHAPAYGEDPWTARATGRLRELLGREAEVLFTFNGTGANVLALAALVRPWEAVICTESAHVQVDECAAPERFTGCKLLPQPTTDGKLRPEQVEAALAGTGDEHRVQPRLVTVAQATEWGTVYTAAELAALAEVAHAHRLLLHVDGARLANAVAHLELPLAALAESVDALTFGGTKNGLVFGEAVAFLRPVDGARFLRKQAMQLASKMRFVSAQFEALLANDLWLRAAGRANAAARRLAEALPEVELVAPVESNAVFAHVPPAAVAELLHDTHFYVWDEERSIVRWMTAFDTSDEDVDEFAGRVRRAVGRAGATKPP